MDKILIEKAKQGDRNAFGQLLELHYDFVRSVAWRWCGHSGDIDDIAQDVCIRLATALTSYRGEGQFRTWLYALTINVARDHLRKSGRDKRTLEEWSSDPTTPDKLSESNQDTLDDLWLAVRSLPPKQCDAVLLVYAEGLTHGEAADVMNCSEATVSWHVHEARKKLKTMLVTV